MIPKSLDQLPELKLDHLHRLTDDTGMLQHSIFTIPNRREGYTTDDNARALIFTVLLGQERKERHSGGAQSIYREPRLSAIQHSWNMPSILRRVDSRIFFAMIAAGTNLSAPKIPTGARCGPLGTVLGRSNDQGLRGAAGACSSFLFPRRWSSAVRAPGPIPCLEFRNISIRIRETATRRKCDPLSAGDCSKCMSRSAARIGNGSRMFWLMETRDCPRLCCWWARLARTIA